MLSSGTVGIACVAEEPNSSPDEEVVVEEAMGVTGIGIELDRLLTDS